LTTLVEILERKGRLLTTEFLPPKTPHLSNLVDKILRIAAFVDSVSVPELKANPTSIPRFRMNPIFAAMRIRDLTGVETTFHLTPRDFNKNAIAGLLLAAAEMRLQNILVIGGDRYTGKEERAMAKNVYDYASGTSLVKAIRNFEQTGAKRFCIVVGTDPTVIYTRERHKVENEISKLLERQDAGAELAQTQPVFDVRYFEFLDHAREQGLKIPILVGILPLRDRQDSVEVESRYGITIPKEVKSSMSANGSAPGRSLAQELAVALVKKGARNIHIYPREDCQFVEDVASSVANEFR